MKQFAEKQLKTNNNREGDRKEMRGRNQECYLVVGVGCNSPFNLCTGKTDVSA